MTTEPDGAVAPWIKRLFLALVIVHLVPIWAVRHQPTIDGPCHLYNAFAMRESVLHHDSAVTRAFRIDWRPHPNWAGHFVLALLLNVASPLVAEKILISGIIILFLWGAWMLAGCDDARGHVFAFLAFP